VRGSPTPEFSLFFLAGGVPDEPVDYQPLLDAARFCDANDFAAVWIPEHHFAAVGSPFPSPAVVAAALAAATRRVGLRAAGVRLPLHGPLRVAEEWAVVDRLSGGRTGLALAAGERAEEFALRPENWAGRDVVLLRYREMLERLWQGGSVIVPGPRGGPLQIHSRPRPVQAELPVWLEVNGREALYREAARIGVGVLVHATRDAAGLTEGLSLYREGFREWQHPRPPRVTLVVPTWIAADTDRALEALRALGGSADPELTLFGSLDVCRTRVRQLVRLGADEIACLPDFGLPTESVLAQLPALDRLRRLAAEDLGVPLPASA
jgi:natural product biosynthesis luciferase-like monooxygenase protein